MALRRACLLFAATHAHAKVLVMGDSVSDWAGQSLAEFCPGQRVVQRSVAGSRAVQWGAPGGGTAQGIGCSDFKDYPCIPSQAFAATDSPSDPVTHVWLQVGAVDWLTSGCYKVLNPAVREQMRQNVSNAISNVAAAKPGIPIVMFAYLRPTMVPNECIVPTGPGGSEETFAVMPVDKMFETHVAMASAIRDACENHPSKHCTYVDVENELAGSPNVLGTPCKYHRDGLHQNNRGYCRMFTHPKAQHAFGCGPQQPMPDCDAVNKTIYKSPRLYTGDAEHHEGWCKDYVPYYAPLRFQKDGPVLLKPDQEPGGGGWDEPIAQHRHRNNKTVADEALEPDATPAPDAAPEADAAPEPRPIANKKALQPVDTALQPDATPQPDAAPEADADAQPDATPPPDAESDYTDAAPAATPPPDADPPDSDEDGQLEATPPPDATPDSDVDETPPDNSAPAAGLSFDRIFANRKNAPKRFGTSEQLWRTFVNKGYLAKMKSADRGSGDETKLMLCDFGAADGSLTAFIAKAFGMDAHAYDIVVPETSLYAGARKRKTMWPVALYDGKNMPEENGSCDIVLFAYVLHHPGESTSKLLREAVRVARPGTGYVLMTEDLSDHHDAVLPARNLLPEAQGSAVIDGEWKSLLQATGLELKQSGRLSGNMNPQTFYISQPNKTVSSR